MSRHHVSMGRRLRRLQRDAFEERVRWLTLLAMLLLSACVLSVLGPARPGAEGQYVAGLALIMTVMCVAAWRANSLTARLRSLEEAEEIWEDSL